IVHLFSLSFSISRLPPASTLFPYTTLFRSVVSQSWRTSGLVPLLMIAAGVAAAALLQDKYDWTVPLPLVFMAVVLVFLGLVHRRSEEHTSELQSRVDLVCRLLLEKKNNFI